MDRPFDPTPVASPACALVETSGGPLVPRRRHVGVHLFAGLWVALVGGGMLALAYYASLPGQAARPPQQVVASAPGTVPRGKASLLLFLHPRCPCSRATLGELARIVSAREERLDTCIFFCRPAGFSADWEKTDLWQMAEAIPGVRAMVDVDGAFARRFGAKTSGQSLLYDGAGRLVFSGGITVARGHAGDNLGASAILSWLSTGEASTEDAPVFGCPLAEEP